MRGGEENEESQFLPEEDQVMEWVQTLDTPDFDVTTNFKATNGFFSTSKVEFFFIALWAYVAKKNSETENEEEEAKNPADKKNLQYSEPEMDDSEWRLNFTVKYEEPEETKKE